MSHFVPFQPSCDSKSQAASRSSNPHRLTASLSTGGGLLCLLLACSAWSHAQAPASELNNATSPQTAAESTPPAALAAQHAVIRWSGVLPGSRSGTLTGTAGKTVQMQFSIYAEQSRGLALWTETQAVQVDAEGRYSVLLGASSPEGLPESLFPAGEPRWVEAHPSGESVEGTRSLIAAVPYAYKSIDAETLAGRAATDYLTRDDLQSVVNAGTGSPSPNPTGDFTPTPAYTGTGTANYLPIWTSSTAFANSLLYQTGGKVGVNSTAPNATLDVNGSLTARGQFYLPSIASATKTAGSNSRDIQLAASAWNTASASAVTQNFQLEAVPVGNNTASTSAALEVLFGYGVKTPAATGLSIASNGRINFASGQTFPGTGTITGIVTTSPLTGGGTSGNITLSLNTTTLESTLNGKYAQLTTGNYFSSSSGSTFNGPITGNSASTMYAIQGNTTSGYAIQGYATGTKGYGVNGYSTGNGGIGVYGNATGNANGTTYPIGVLAHVFSGTGVKSTLDEALIGQTAVLGQTNGSSGVYTDFQADGLVGGVWGDIANSSSLTTMGIAGTADNGYGGVFENNSDAFATLFIYNIGTAGKTNVVERQAGGAAIAGHFATLMAGSPSGTCGIGGNGDLSCTGQIKTLVNTHGGERTVETYSVQSAENWMEDFGSGSLQQGSMLVKLDPEFAETISNSADYHVFLTPRGDSKGLYVTNVTPTGFEVRESGGGTASIGFDYRIVAKRRGLESQRMTDVTERFKAEIAAAPHAKTKLAAASNHQHP